MKTVFQVLTQPVKWLVVANFLVSQVRDMDEAYKVITKRSLYKLQSKHEFYNLASGITTVIKVDQHNYFKSSSAV